MGSIVIGKEIIVEAFSNATLGHGIAAHVVQTFGIRAMRRWKRAISVPFANAEHCRLFLLYKHLPDNQLVYTICIHISLAIRLVNDENMFCRLWYLELPYHVVIFPSKKNGPTVTSANVWIAVSGSMAETKQMAIEPNSLELFFNVSRMLTFEIAANAAFIS